MNFFGAGISHRTLRDIFLILVGTLLATVGQLVMFFLQGLRDRRNSKKAIYSDFLSGFSHGIRINQELMQIESKLSHLEEKKDLRIAKLAGILSAFERSEISNEEAYDSKVSQSLILRMESLRHSAESFFERIDKSLSDLYLVAPFHIIQLAKVIRVGLDQWRETDEYASKMSNVYEDFARILQRDSISVWLSRFHFLRQRKKCLLWFK